MAPDPANGFPEARDCSAYGLMIKYRIVHGFFSVFLCFDVFFLKFDNDNDILTDMILGARRV